MKYVFSLVLTCGIILVQAQQQRSIQLAMDSIRVIDAKEKQLEAALKSNMTQLRNEFTLRMKRISDSLQLANRQIIKLQTELNKVKIDSTAYKSNAAVARLKHDQEAISNRIRMIDYHLRKSRKLWTTSLVFYGLAVFVAASATAILRNDPNSKTPEALYPTAVSLGLIGSAFRFKSNWHIGSIQKAPNNFP